LQNLAKKLDEKIHLPAGTARNVFFSRSCLFHLLYSYLYAEMMKLFTNKLGANYLPAAA